MITPVGQYAEIQPLSVSSRFGAAPVYAKAEVIAVSPDLELPVKTGDSIYFVNGKRINLEGRVFILGDYIELIKTV